MTISSNQLVRRNTAYDTIGGTDNRTVTAAGSDQANTGSGAGYIYARNARKTGRKYFEVTLITPTNGAADQGFGVGVFQLADQSGTSTGQAADGEGGSTSGSNTGRHVLFNLGSYVDYYNSGSKDGPGTSYLWPNQNANTYQRTIGVLLDLASTTTRLVFFFRDSAGVLQSTIAPSFNPAAGTWYSPFIQFYTNQTPSLSFNGGQEAFSLLGDINTATYGANILGWDDDGVVVPGTGTVTVDAFAIETMRRLTAKVEVTQLAVEIMKRRAGTAVVSYLGLEVLEQIARARVDQFAVEVMKRAPNTSLTKAVLAMLNLETLEYVCPRDAVGVDYTTLIADTNLDANTSSEDGTGTGYDFTLASNSSLRISMVGTEAWSFTPSDDYNLGPYPKTWTMRFGISDLTAGTYASYWTDLYLSSAEAYAALHGNPIEISLPAGSYRFFLWDATVDDNRGAGHYKIEAGAVVSNDGLPCGPSAQVNAVVLEVLEPTSATVSAGTTAAQLSLVVLEILEPTKGADLHGGVS